MTVDTVVSTSIECAQNLVDIIPESVTAASIFDDNEESLEDGSAVAGDARSRVSVKSALQRGDLVSRDTVDMLMREQDAYLLDSMHGNAKNETRHTADPSSQLASPANSRSLSRLSLILSSADQQAVEHMMDQIPMERMGRVGSTSTAEDGEHPDKQRHDLEAVRRALSGELWLKQDIERARNEGALSFHDAASTSSGAGEDEIFGNDAQDIISSKQFETNASRRKSEAAQFAEAVGELEPSEQEDLRIIEEDVDDSDDDDDAVTQVLVQTARIAARQKSEAAQFAEAVGEIARSEQDDLRIIEDDEADDDDDDDDDGDVREINVDDSEAASASVDTKALSTGTKSQVKTRPQWPCGGTRATMKRIFLVKLPEVSTSQEFVYKGLKSNPPEIVKRGIQRGNYAQLHRKAWLEVSDKYHRYGKNLRLYYRHWESLGFPTNMFFDWLDSKGEAAGRPLPELEECPRSKLDADTVLYILNMEVTNGYGLQVSADDLRRGKVLDVDGDPVITGTEGWIFVLRDGVMYGAQKVTTITGQSKQRFHHSSFFGGKAVAAAGIFITDEEGILTRLYPHSGHYRPGEADMQRVLFYLHHQGLDLRTFDVDLQQILHVARDDAKKETKKKKDNTKKDGGDDKKDKKRKVESLQLVPAVLAACFLAHKARFIGEGIFDRIHQIRDADVASVSEALALINYDEEPS